MGSGHRSKSPHKRRQRGMQRRCHQRVHSLIQINVSVAVAVICMAFA